MHVSKSFSFLPIGANIFRNTLGRNIQTIKSRHAHTVHDLIKQLPVHFLRMSASSCYIPDTYQRNDISVDPEEGRIIKRQNVTHNYSIQSAALNNASDGCIIEFSDGQKSEFSLDWIQTQVDRLNSQQQLSDHDICHKLARIPWSDMTENTFRAKSISFDDLIIGQNYEKYIENALKILFEYGICLITATPTEDNGCGVAALSSALSGPANKGSNESSPLQHYRHCVQNNLKPKPILEHATHGPFRTLYGNVWSTSIDDMTGGASVADSAYTNEALPLHTDMGYYRDPPGLQIFTMVSPADVGGESFYGDGLAVAEHMRKNHPKEFDTLCRTVRRYRSIDGENGWHLEASGSVVKAIDRWQGCKGAPPAGAERWGAVVAIRHNDLDRLPDLPPLDVIEEGKEAEFY